MFCYGSPSQLTEHINKYPDKINLTPWREAPIEVFAGSETRCVRNDADGLLEAHGASDDIRAPAKGCSQD